MHAGNGWNVIVDSQKYGPYDAVLEGTPRFNDDGTQVSWVEKRGESWFIQRMKNSDPASEGPFSSHTAA
jgi:hypothetical protein